MTDWVPGRTLVEQEIVASLIGLVLGVVLFCVIPELWHRWRNR